ncbi:MAG: M23 family metallopeptidase [Desulfosarcinaceae bacterium]|nr:M23 family metallopeptidase [Desulfosarcinaceae bacterium]
MKTKLILLLSVLLVGAAVWLLVDRMEGEKPQVTIDRDLSALGASQTIQLTLTDRKSGLRRIWMAILKDGQEHVIYQKRFESAGFPDGGLTGEAELPVTIDTVKLGLKDGKALLRLSVWDYSWRKWGKGNQTYIEKEVLIDSQPPTVSLLSHAHNLNQGGAGLVIYRLSEECPQSGVLVGETFYKGYAGYSSDKAIHLAFFALTHEQGPGTHIELQARDVAGNLRQTGIPHHINKRTFRKDVLNIPDSFLERKMPEFLADMPDNASLPPVQQFLQVNSALRKANSEAIYAVTRTSEAQLFWKDTFLRLPNAANRARFADAREYRHNGKVIDHQFHMGIDLASLALSSIPAANAGKVVFAESLGIYGQTVIIDHGFGLFSLYGHCSSIDVAVGQMVARGETIGKTGTTGLAGGDHLHYGMLVSGTYVNPIEWWDAQWIENNIRTKLEAVPAS